MWAELQVQQVQRRTGPQVEAGEPDQYSVLETLGQVRSGGVPGQVPVLKPENTTQLQICHQFYVVFHCCNINSVFIYYFLENMIFSTYLGHKASY